MAKKVVQKKDKTRRVRLLLSAALAFNALAIITSPSPVVNIAAFLLILAALVAYSKDR